MAKNNDTPNRANLTKGRIERFTCPPGKQQAFLWDTTVTGLGVRATAGGSKAFVFQSRFNGRALRITIGAVSAWDIAGARAEARRLQTLIDQGIDPRLEKAKRARESEAQLREMKRQAVTFGEAWGAYIEARRDSWGELYLRDHLQMMQQPGLPKKRGKDPTVAGPLWRFKDMRLVELTPEKLREWLATEGSKRPTVTARAYRILRAFLRWLAETPEYAGLVDPDKLLNGEVRRLVPSSGARDDVLQREQLAPWFEAVRAIPNPVISAYLQTLLLTGARRGELAPLQWEDVDFQWRSVTIGDKVEGRRVIPLTPYIAGLLEALPRRNRFVFSSITSKSGHIEDPRRPYRQALDAAGLPHITLHGLRRSFASLAEWVEAPIGVVAQIMGHRPSATAERHYKRRPLDLLRLWHEKLESWILEQAGVSRGN